MKERGIAGLSTQLDVLEGTAGNPVLSRDLVHGVGQLITMDLVVGILVNLTVIVLELWHAVQAIVIPVAVAVRLLYILCIVP